MKILVMAAAGIGDCLIATPLLHELRLHFPEARLHVLVLWKGSKDLLEGNPHVDVIHQKNFIQDGKADGVRFLAGLRREKFDLSITAHPQGRIHYRAVARFIGARRRLCHEYETFHWLDPLLVHQTIPQDYSVHSVENNLRLLALLGRQPLRPRAGLEVHLAPEEEAWAAEWMARHELTPRRRLGLHIGSGGTKNLRRKRWPFAHWLELIRRVRQSHPEAALILFGGPEEQREHAQILAETNSPRVLAPPTKNLRQAAALLRHLDGFISVDTALMHLAAAMQAPNQIVIEAPTLNPTNVPWQTDYRLVRNPVVNGRPLDYYRYDGGPIRGTDEELLRCMASITVEEVHRVVSEALARPPVPGAST